jgi:NTE family protein
MGSRRLFRPSVLILALACVLATAGCAKRYVNEPLGHLDPTAGYRYVTETPKNSEDIFMVLAFSGGGTRASSLDYGVLQELARTEVVIDGRKRRLLDEVDVISSVSGGSFTAAYYGLFGDRIFEDFEDDFLKVKAQSKLTRKMFSPWVWPKLWSPAYNRDDMAVDLYNKLIFEDKTFADLADRMDRPFIIINASDMALGARWEFTQDQFDFICSDLLKFPIARAVMASSAVPGAFGTILLKNRANECGDHTPGWVDEFLTDPDATFRMKNKANEARTYTQPTRKYVHLVDGGITDNIGIRSVLDMTLRQSVVQDNALLERAAKVERLVVVVVDAHVEKESKVGQKKKVGLFNLIFSSATVPMNRYSYESLELFQETLRRLVAAKTAERAERAKKAGVEPRPLELYPVYLEFNNLPSKEESDFFKTMPTAIQLDHPEDVDRLAFMAASALSRSSSYQRLLEDLDATVKPRPEPEPEDPKKAKKHRPKKSKG